ncbi:MAG: biotin/lipoyl-containing protein [Granulosicoccus sp.]
MPHEIIMPALGVAQDTGLIIAWLKQSGDAIKTGDALMEIETDKAIVEVEAQADGYLTHVSATAGEHVPVGQVVALISDTVDEVNSTQSDSAESETRAIATEIELSDRKPEGKEIIMPALGMAQDTGLIVVWHKQPGDSVVATDILLEVETDKSIMQVEAGHDGYVAAIIVDAQKDVPVGSTIAIISPTKPDNILARKSVDPAVTVDTDLTEVAQTAKATPENTTHSRVKRHTQCANTVEPRCQSGSRILASPKMRRLAIKQGLDLEQLVMHGVPQPFHVSDLETLKTLKTQKTLDKLTPTPNFNAHGAMQAECAPVALRVEVRVTAKNNIEFLDWMAEHKNICIPPRMAWLRYASAALRKTRDPASEPMIVELRQLQQTDGCYANADHSRLSQPLTTSVDQTPGLVLRDFSASRITSITTAAQLAPVLTISREYDDYAVSLDYRTDQLDENVAIDFITDFTSRLADPLRQLL